MPSRPSRVAADKKNMNILVVFAFLTIHVKSVEFGLKWGQKCKIPGPSDFLKPTEECEMSKGLQCQMYQQGTLCGCPIRSSLSWDERAGECRRKPGHHCPYHTDEKAYDTLPYNHKCHNTAECTIVEPIPEVEATEKKSPSTAASVKKQDQFATCRCKPGYKESRDGFVCHSVNASITNTITVILLIISSIFTAAVT